VTASDETARRSARRLASEILVKVDTRKAYADVLLDQTLRGADLDPADRALLTELVYGTLRWRGALDGRLQRQLRRPLGETDPRIRNLLRLTCYQLFYLDRIPSYAAVNEAVELAKSYGGRKAASFVNGVLRNLLRESESIPVDGSAASLAIQYSHPEWLVRRWLAEFGADEAGALMRADNERAPLALRVNSLKCDREQLLDRLSGAGVEAKAALYARHGIVLSSAGAVENLAGFAEGLFQIQGEASQLVVQLLGPLPGERILDACAAPGGKSTYIAELQNDEGEVVAVDISARGIERIRQNADRLGLRSIRVIAADATQALGDLLNPCFDRILLDAPCSGLGTLRGHPEIKWHREESDIRRLSLLQRKLLDRVAGYLNPDGVLVYSTCTLSVDENEGNVEAFLAAHPEFELEDCARYLPSQASHMTRGKYFQALPQRDNTDGFFAARLRKVD
jgi:16S rRNA (cytosine967-C5)-methyltransferase